MKRDAIKVGAKSKSKRSQLRLSYNRAETVADCLQICHNNEAAVAALFNRGYTIWLQDRFGRPMFEENAAESAIQEAFDSAIPGETKGFSQKTQPSANVPATGTFTAAQVAEMLAKQGFKVTQQ